MEYMKWIYEKQGDHEMCGKSLRSEHTLFMYRENQIEQLIGF